MTDYAAIRKDPRFIAECVRADKKANAACERVRDRLSAREEKEIARHSKVMREISDAHRAIFKEVYRPIYDPLEEAAFVRAENRLRKN